MNDVDDILDESFDELLSMLQDENPAMPIDSGSPMTSAAETSIGYKTADSETPSPDKKKRKRCQVEGEKQRLGYDFEDPLELMQFLAHEEIKELGTVVYPSASFNFKVSHKFKGGLMSCPSIEVFHVPGKECLYCIKQDFSAMLPKMLQDNGKSAKECFFGDQLNRRLRDDTMNWRPPADTQNTSSEPPDRPCLPIIRLFENLANRLKAKQESLKENPQLALPRPAGMLSTATADATGSSRHLVANATTSSIIDRDPRVYTESEFWEMQLMYALRRLEDKPTIDIADISREYIPNAAESAMMWHVTLLHLTRRYSLSLRIKVALTGTEKLLENVPNNLSVYDTKYYIYKSKVCGVFPCNMILATTNGNIELVDDNKKLADYGITQDTGLVLNIKIAASAEAPSADVSSETSLSGDTDALLSDIEAGLNTPDELLKKRIATILDMHRAYYILATSQEKLLTTVYCGLLLLTKNESIPETSFVKGKLYFYSNVLMVLVLVVMMTVTNWEKQRPFSPDGAVRASLFRLFGVNLIGLHVSLICFAYTARMIMNVVSYVLPYLGYSSIRYAVGLTYQSALMMIGCDRVSFSVAFYGYHIPWFLGELYNINMDRVRRCFSFLWSNVGFLLPLSVFAGLLYFYITYKDGWIRYIFDAANVVNVFVTFAGITLLSVVGITQLQQLRVSS